MEDVGSAVSTTVSIHMFKLQTLAKRFSIPVLLALEGCRSGTAQILKHQ